MDSGTMGTLASMREMADARLERQRRRLQVGQPPLPRHGQRGPGPQHGQGAAGRIERIRATRLERDAATGPGDEVVPDAHRHVPLRAARRCTASFPVGPPAGEDEWVEPARVVEADEVAARGRAAARRPRCAPAHTPRRWPGWAAARRRTRAGSRPSGAPRARTSPRGIQPRMRPGTLSSRPRPGARWAGRGPAARPAAARPSAARPTRAARSPR